MRKVLLASSVESFLERNKKFLEDKDFFFLTASGGTDAVRLHTEHQFDLILSEIMLSDMDITTLSNKLQAVNSDRMSHLIAICYDNLESIAQAKACNASAILLRPINPKHLLITIGSFIDMQLARSKRVKLRCDVVCNANQFDFVCHSQDISVTGILLETGYDIRIGSTLNAAFNLPDIGGIELRATVVRTQVNGCGTRVYGAKFLELSDDVRNKINRYVVKYPHSEVLHSLEQSTVYSQC